MNIFEIKNKHWPIVFTTSLLNGRETQQHQYDTLNLVKEQTDEDNYFVKDGILYFKGSLGTKIVSYSPEYLYEAVSRATRKWLLMANAMSK